MAQKGVSAKVVISGIVVGLLICFIGAVIINATAITKKTTELGKEEYESAATANRNAAVVWNVGILVLSIFMMLGAVYCAEIPEFARLGLLVALGLIVVGDLWYNTWGAFSYPWS